MNKQIRFKTPTLQSDLCDYCDEYIVVKRTITVEADNYEDKRNKSLTLALKNNSPFIGCISKVNNVLIDNAEGLDIVTPMYNLIEYIKKYSKISRILWNCYRDELTNDRNDNNNFNKNLVNSKSFKYKTSIIGSTYNVDEDNNADVADKVGTKEVEIVVSLKNLSNFWRKLDIPLINCEVSLNLTWSENCVITKLDKTVRAAPGNNPVLY